MTISLGIVISMFTAIVLVRLLTSYWLRRDRPKTLTIGTRFRFFPEGTSIPFMRARYAGLMASALISLASIGLAIHPGLKMGIDFSGGVIIEAKATGVVDATVLQSNLINKGVGLSKCRVSAAQMTCFSISRIRKELLTSSRRLFDRLAMLSNRRCRGRRSAEWKWSGRRLAQRCKVTAYGR